MAFLGRLESRLPVNEWTLDGVRIWPLIRTILFHRLNLSLRGSEVAPPASTGKAARILNAVRAPFRDPGKNLPREAPAEVFVLTYAGIRQARIGGDYVDIRTGPLIDLLGSRNIGCHAWEYAVPRLYQFPRRNPTHLVQREFYGVQLRNRLLGRSLDTNLPGYAGFCTAIRDKGALYPELQERNLLREFGLILSLRDRFEQAFDLIHPSVAFTSNMGRYEFGLNLACRRRGVLSVELQHGAFVLHGQYASWRRVPPEGYDLLPDAFWCWDDATAALINEWSDRCAPRHRAVVGGNPWLEACASLAPDPPPSTGRKKGLLTLQPPERMYSDGRLLPAFVLDALTRVDKDWVWWVRAHPAWPCDTSKLADMLHRRGLKAEFERAGSAPLPHLLSQADLHLTHSSSTVLEAERFGVPSIVWSGTGADLYASQIAAGTCRAALDAESLAREIGAMPGSKKPPPELKNRPMAETLDHFLELGRKMKRERPIPAKSPERSA